MVRDGADTVFAYVSSRVPQLNMTRVREDGGVEARALYQAADNHHVRGGGWARSGSRELVVWGEHTLAVPNHRIFYMYLDDYQPRRLDQRDGAHQFPYVAGPPDRVAVAYNYGMSFGGVWLAFPGDQ